MKSENHHLMISQQDSRVPCVCFCPSFASFYWDSILRWGIIQELKTTRKVKLCKETLLPTAGFKHLLIWIVTAFFGVFSFGKLGVCVCEYLLIYIYIHTQLSIEAEIPSQAWIWNQWRFLLGFTQWCCGFFCYPPSWCFGFSWDEYPVYKQLKWQ